MARDAFRLDPAGAAKRITASRTAFADCFDQLAELYNGRRFATVASQRQRKVALPAGPARDAADYEAAFKEARAHEFFEPLLRLYGDQLLGAPSKRKSSAIIPALVAPDNVSRKTVLAAYQKVMNSRGFACAQDISYGLMRAMRNTCSILIDDTSTGTGFLIGPRLVLTCWHVVQSLLDAHQGEGPQDHPGTCSEGSGKRLSVQFDFVARAGKKVKNALSCGVTEDWLVTGSRAAACEHELDNLDDGVRSNWPNETADLDTFLDFAVIELDSPAGFDRGYYDICSSSMKPANDAMVVLQHPLQYSMRFAEGTFNVPQSLRETFASTAQSTCRTLHNANTERGSSGGLCLNYEMEPVAMHQASLELRSEGDVKRKHQTNVAIPLTAIIAKAGPIIKRRIGDFKALRYQLGNGKALIGRARLQEAVAAAIIGIYKILVVQIDYDQDYKPPRQIGKTFSTDIVSSFLNRSLHRVVRVSAASTKESAYKTATELLNAVSSGLASQLPTEDALKAESQSTQLNDTAALLANKVGELLASVSTRNILWIVIDELDLHPLTNGSTRQFFDKLYPEIAARDCLRLVLIGFSDPDLPSLQKVGPKKVEELKVHLQLDDVKQWISLRLGGIVVPDEEVLCSFAKIAIAVAEGYGKPICSATVSRVINEIFEPSFPDGPI